MQVAEIKLEPNKLNIIGVVGNSGSGKSTATDYLRDRLGAKVISLDNYYKGLPEGILADDYNFDRPEAIDWSLLKEHLGLLARGVGVFIHEYNFATHSRSSQGKILQVKQSEWLILEGTMVCADPEIVHLLVAVIYIYASPQICLGRRILRDVSRGRSPDMVRKRWERDVIPFYLDWLKPIEDKQFNWCSKVFVIKNINLVEDLFESLDVIATLWTGQH